MAHNICTRGRYARLVMRSCRTDRLRVAGLAVAAALGAAPAGAADRRGDLPAIAVTRSDAVLREATSLPLRFGIYPGGGVGMVGRAEDPLPDAAAARLDALRRLRGDGRRLILHIYSEWDGTQTPSRARAAALAEVGEYTRAGFEVEPVIRYRPARVAGAATVRRFAAHVRRTVKALAANPGVVAVQIANEANVAGAPDAADGAYPYAREALVSGVITAAWTLRALGRRDIGVGFNWAAGASPRRDAAFWRGLRRRGGAALARTVDWVGVDIYPGTWSRAGSGSPAAVGDAMVSTLRYLRTVALPRAGLEDRGIALHISENGFPTGPERDEQLQAEQLRAAIGAVEDVRHRYGVTDYRWFDLRDSRTGGGVQHGYGVLRDDYSEKPAFAVLAGLVQQLGR